MRTKNKPGALLIFCLLIAISACGIVSTHIKDNAIVNSLSVESQNSYNNGKGILLFSFIEAHRNTEAYADWAEYLNEFKFDSKSEFLIHQIEGQTKVALNIKTDEFSIFLKEGYPTYFYDGLIVEPQVYTAVYKVYSKQELSGMDKSFLPEELCTSPACNPKFEY